MKKFLPMLVIPIASALAQNTAAPVPPPGGPSVAPPALGEPGPNQFPQTAAPIPGQPGPAAPFPAAGPGPIPGQPGPAAPYPAAVPGSIPGQPGPAPFPHAGPQHHPQARPAIDPATGRAPIPGQPGPAPFPHAGPQHHPQPGQPGAAPFPHAGPQHHPQPGQPGPGAFHPGQHPEGPNGPHAGANHEDHVGFVIGIDQEKELIRIQTKQGPVSLKVTEETELLFPGLHEGPAFDIDPEKFEGKVKGKMVRIASREGKADHIKPIRP